MGGGAVRGAKRSGTTHHPLNVRVPALPSIEPVEDGHVGLLPWLRNWGSSVPGEGRRCRLSAVEALSEFAESGDACAPADGFDVVDDGGDEG